MIPRYFIDRPVLANVMAIICMVLGAIALSRLPVAQYPQLTPPTIQVSTTYPGANAEAVQQQIARLIESQVNGVEGMLYMQSYASNDGRYTLTVSFKVGTDADQAQVAVQNRVNIALPLLPAAVQQQGVQTRKKSTSILQIATIKSTDPALDALYLSNFATLSLHDRLARLPGVADVNVFGIGQYSMRIWLNAAQMKQRNLVPAAVVAVINDQNQRISGGQMGMPPAALDQRMQLTVTIDNPLTTAEDFSRLIVATASDGSVTRLSDVARVELGSANYNQGFSFDNQPAAGIAIYQLPDANALDTAKAVADEMKRLSRTFPKGVTYDVPFDTTRFVNASISEVYTTLFEAGALVLIVILVFLQSWRATLVPATTVPVTVIGAFAAMALLGFSINLLTLFALVLCIGIVVDDAIVVVEGVTQHIELGKTPRQSAIDAMRELTGPIIGITLVLVSVFLPASFIPGITGQLYKQFALVIAGTAILSAMNALSLKPVQSAKYLQAPSETSKPGAWANGFNSQFRRLENRYMRGVAALIRHRWITAGFALALIGLTVFGFTRIPTGFIPTEDQGYLMVAVQLPDAATLGRTQQMLRDVVSSALEVPGVEHGLAIAGVSPLDANAPLANAGVVYVVLRDWSERGHGQDLRSIYQALNTRMANLTGGNARVLLPPAISGLGMSGGFQMQIELTDGSNDTNKLDMATRSVLSAASHEPSIFTAFTSLRVQVPQIRLRLNHARAESLGVNIGDAYKTLQTYLGSSYVNQFSKFGQDYPVYVQADQPYRSDPASISRLTVASRSGQMVPVSAFMDSVDIKGPAIVSQYNLMPSAAINGLAAPGYSSGQALDALERVAKSELPPGTDYEWTAMSYQERLAGNSVTLVFCLALLLVYLVLAGQYGSWVTPLSVIMAVPLALMAPVGMFYALGLPNNAYVQIGLVLLIALSAKNAILIVEVANESWAQGMGLVDSALEGARRRFRPIIMTSLAFILGVLPLVLAHGAGAAARKSIGITVFSGMLASTVFAVALVPVFFVAAGSLVERQRSAKV